MDFLYKERVEEKSEDNDSITIYGISLTLANSTYRLSKSCSE